MKSAKKNPMRLLDLTLSPVLNLALDDALIESAENADIYPEVLRLWEPKSPMVVIGRSSPLSMEVNLEACKQDNVPVFRRISGGQSIVTGPGCLMYAVLLDYRLRPELRMLDRAHEFVMSQLRKALNSIGIDAEMKGTCDLVYDGRKFSGNALRCRRNWFLYHGTILLESFDTGLITRYLGNPKRQPDYRAGRSHADFITSIPVDARAVKLAITQQLQASDDLYAVPIELARELATEKYNDEDWLGKVP